MVENPSEIPVLLCEGEQVLGAQQDRIFDVSVLVPAGSKLEVPVSCVEAGRWQHSRHADELTPSPQCSHPEFRQMKTLRKSARIAEHVPVTAVDHGNGPKLRCPACGAAHPLDASWPGRVIPCPACGRELRVNPFVVPPPPRWPFGWRRRLPFRRR